MEIIPAIDLKNGKCVRLYQGDYHKETIFSEDPVAVALKWQSLGAKRLHLIDLDGAATGMPRNINTIKNILTEIRIPVQMGGGIRDEKTVNNLLLIGIQRVIMGTVAIEKPELIKKLCDKNPDSIVVSIDARDGYVATHGWLKDTEVRVISLAQKMKRLGVPRILYTDIKRDGTLTEPDFNTIEKLTRTVKIAVIAAGGISKIEQLKKLSQIGADGAVIGKALYTGDINLKEAISLY